jgi:hypothetical protein
MTETGTASCTTIAVLLPGYTEGLEGYFFDRLVEGSFTVTDRYGTRVCDKTISTILGMIDGNTDELKTRLENEEVEVMHILGDFGAVQELHQIVGVLDGSDPETINATYKGQAIFVPQKDEDAEELIALFFPFD